MTQNTVLMPGDVLVHCSLYLDLRAIIAFKMTCKHHYQQLEDSTPLLKHMYQLALKQVPPASLISSEESNQVMTQLEETQQAIAEREWTQIRSVYTHQLQPLRDSRELSADDKKKYLCLLKSLGQDYCNKTNFLHKVTAGTDCSVAEYYLSVDEDVEKGEIVSVREILDVVVNDPDLTLEEKDHYVCEVVDNRIDSLVGYW